MQVFFQTSEIEQYLRLHPEDIRLSSKELDGKMLSDAIDKLDIDEDCKNKLKELLRED